MNNSITRFALTAAFALVVRLAAPHFTFLDMTN